MGGSGLVIGPHCFDKGAMSKGFDGSTTWGCNEALDLELWKKGLQWFGHVGCQVAKHKNNPPSPCMVIHVMPRLFAFKWSFP